jgi:hypothetical protein
MRYAINSSPDFSNLSQTAQRHDYVILQVGQKDKMQQIKAADPSTKVLVYKNLTASTNASSTGLSSTGVSYQEANSQHPEWFLKNTSGERFTFRHYSYLWAMDVGSASYQQRWADNVIADLKRDGWDGVFLDDTNTSMSYHYDVSRIAKYPTDAAWQAATESALAHIGPRVQAAGKLAISNIGLWGSYPAVGRSWFQYLDGAMDEHFAKAGDTAGSGYASEGHWQNDLESLKYAQQQGKAFLGVTHSADGDAAAARYGWATTLLGAQGRAYHALHSIYKTENWFPEYEYEIGEPVGAESRDPNGVHRRQFTNGIVVVNPTTSQLSAELCGTYSGSGLDHVTSVTLAPKSGAILVRDGSGGDCGGDTGGGDGESSTGTEIEPGGKKVKRGKIIARGKLKGVDAAERSEASGEPGVIIELSRRGRTAKRVTVRPRSNGRFVGRIPICRRGRYRIAAGDENSGVRAKWPRPARVTRKKARC